jgi:hypothetical protein
MNIKGIRKFIPVLIIVLLIAALVPAVSAYEGHLVDIKAHVEGTPPTTRTGDKVMRLAEPSEIAASGRFPAGTVNTVTSPDNVPLKTLVIWVVTITVNNLTGDTMYLTEVDDNFNAEVTIDIIDASQGTAEVEESGNPGNPLYHKVYWNIGTIVEGNSATLNLLVWTRVNNGGQQEYTSTGQHWLNESGVTVKWDYPEGHQESYNSGSLLPVTVYE